MVGSAARRNSIYTNVCSTGSTQEELETKEQQENDDIIAITGMWWDDTHNWSAAMRGNKVFRRDGQGEVMGLVRECFDCLDLGDDRVECLCVRIMGKVNKANILVCFCSRPPNQDEERDKAFNKEPMFSWGTATYPGVHQK